CPQGGGLVTARRRGRGSFPPATLWPRPLRRFGEASSPGRGGGAPRTPSQRRVDRILTTLLLATLQRRDTSGAIAHAHVDPVVQPEEVRRVDVGQSLVPEVRGLPPHDREVDRVVHDRVIELAPDAVPLVGLRGQEPV